MFLCVLQSCSALCSSSVSVDVTTGGSGGHCDKYKCVKNMRVAIRIAISNLSVVDVKYFK